MEQAKQVAIVLKVNQQLTYKEKQVVLSWLQELLRIRDSSNPMQYKVYRAIQRTLESDLLRGIVTVIWGQLKSIGWDDRSWSARLSMYAAAVALLVFGGQGAGIAALGGAIGVPLWIICGAGGAFAGMLIQELQKPSR